MAGWTDEGEKKKHAEGSMRCPRQQCGISSSL